MKNVTFIKAFNLKNMNHALWVSNRKDNPNRWGIYVVVIDSKRKENIMISQYFNGEDEDTYFSIGTNHGTSFINI